MKAQSLLEVARRHPQFPIVLETYRECLQDVLDVPGLTEILTKLRTRELGLVEVETDRASPMASSLLFDYVATYMYEGDQPNAERRAAALSLDRELLAELLGQEELRDLLDARAVEAVEDELQHRAERARARDADELQEVLRHVGDLTVAEIAERIEPAGLAHAEQLVASLAEERRAVQLRIGGEDRWIATDDAGLFRDAIGVVPPSTLPQRLLETVPNALERLVERYAATHAPFTTAELHGRYLVDPAAVLAGLEARGALVRGELRPGGTGREWCDPEVLRRLRRASLASLRQEIEPSDQRALASFLPSWHGIDRHAAAGAGPDRLRDVLVPLQGLALPAAAWESAVLPRRLGAYSQSWLDQLCASGEVVWIGAGALGRDSGRVAFYFREDAPLLGRPIVPGQPRAPEPPQGGLHDQLRERLAAGACFFTDLLVAVPAPASELHEALWDLVWAGEVTNDAFQPLRAGRSADRKRLERAANPTAASARRRRFSQRRGAAPAQSVGRWSLTAPLLLPEPSQRDHDRARAELLLERHGILTRELVLAEGMPGGFAAIYPALSDLETLGVARRGYFVEGLGGAQFALPGAVDRLRSFEDRSLQRRPPVVLDAVDPAQPYGASLPWPKREASTSDRQHGDARPPARRWRRRRARGRRAGRLPRALAQGHPHARPAGRRAPRAGAPRARRARPHRPQAPPDRAHRRRCRRRSPPQQPPPGRRTGGRPEEVHDRAGVAGGHESRSLAANPARDRCWPARRVCVQPGRELQLVVAIVLAHGCGAGREQGGPHLLRGVKLELVGLVRSPVRAVRLGPERDDRPSQPAVCCR